MSTPAVVSLRAFRGLLVTACVFAMVGGYMDAYSFLARGHVFANAQTGNVVLFAIHVSGREWAEAWRTIPPIVAFGAGIAFARLFRVRSVKRTFRATLICQYAEFAVLLVIVVFGERVPSDWVVPSIAFVAALQNASFSKIGPWDFNSAMTTSNIRNAVSGFVELALGETDPNLKGKAVVGSTIFVCFLSGGLLGGLFTRYDASRGLAPCVVLVAAGILLTWRQRLRARNG